MTEPRRDIALTTVPSGARVLELLPDLRRALAGTGPALLPLGENDPRAADVATALGARTPLNPGEDDPNDPTALAMPTSGSTGTPKGVLLNAGALAASAAATEQRLGGPGHWLLALPAEHIAGMQVLLRAARAGTEPVVLNTENGFSAANFVISAQRLAGPRRYVSLVPTQLRRILADPDAATATAEIFDAVLVGGSATPAALLGDARDAGIRVVTTYGMTETCGGCVYDGVPLPGASATINTDGAIVLTGPMVARGYRHQPGHAAFATPGSFVTADSGVLDDATGVLRVTGRLDDLITTGGLTVAPAPIEQAIAALPGISDVVVVGTPDDEWGQAVTAVIVCATVGGRSATGGDPGGQSARVDCTLERLRDAVHDLSAEQRPQRLVRVDAIPQLPSGKPDRAAVRAITTASCVPGRVIDRCGTHERREGPPRACLDEL